MPSNTVRVSLLPGKSQPVRSCWKPSCRLQQGGHPKKQQPKMNQRRCQELLLPERNVTAGTNRSRWPQGSCQSLRKAPWCASLLLFLLLLLDKPHASGKGCPNGVVWFCLEGCRRHFSKDPKQRGSYREEPPERQPTRRLGGLKDPILNLLWLVPNG